MKFVLDSYALIAYLQREKGFEKVKHALEVSAKNGVKVIMTTVNWGEVYYIIKREEGEDVAEAMAEIIESLPIQLLPADKLLTKQAAVFKSENKMSYADCFAAAAAVLNKATLITGDKEFREVESVIRVVWL